MDNLNSLILSTYFSTVANEDQLKNQTIILIRKVTKKSFITSLILKSNFTILRHEFLKIEIDFYLVWNISNPQIKRMLYSKKEQNSSD